MAFREFSTSEGVVTKELTIDSDASNEFRNELVDLVFTLARDAELGEAHFYRLMTQNIGAYVAENPYGGYRYAIGRDLLKAEWVRVYDLLPRLADEFRRVGLFDQFRSNLNRILAGNGIVWDLDEEGRLVRNLPEGAGRSVRVAMSELSRPEFKAAHKLLLDAIDAYNDQPQRSRDACANATVIWLAACSMVRQSPSFVLDAAGVLRMGPQESSIQLFQAWRIVRGGPHRFCRSLGSDLRRRGPLDRRTPGNYHRPFDQRALISGLLCNPRRVDSNLQCKKSDKKRA